MTASDCRGRICIYSPFLYPVTAEGVAEVAGGTEVRQWALARGLAARGFDVTIATCDFGQEAVVVRNDVRLMRTYSMSAGVRWLRLFYPRLWKAFRVLLAADADVYVAAGAGMPAGWAYDAARLRKAGFVFLAAHDDDTIPALPFLRTRRERWWYRRALAGADARIAQSTAQHAFLRAGFNLDSEVVASPAELPSRLADPGENETVVWLSTYRHHKRPTWFVELARRLPQLHFVMNGMPAEGDDDSTLPAIRRAAADLPNLEVGGFVERTRVTEYLGRAGLFVQTSPAEGFPMSLLEVWSLGIPSVTTVDPDGTIERHGVGEVVSTVEELAESVSRLMSAPDLRREMGLRARRYVEEQHGPDRTYEPLAAVLDRVIERRRGRGRLAGSHGAGEGDSGASERGCDRGR